MKIGKQLRNALLIAIWLIVLTMPIMVIRNNTITDNVDFRWNRLWLVGIGGFVVAFVWNFLLSRQKGARRGDTVSEENAGRLSDRLLGLIRLNRASLRQRKVAVPLLVVLAVVLIGLPFVVKVYPINVMISVLIYIVLALGLNIVIGLGGMLHLGYAAGWGCFR